MSWSVTGRRQAWRASVVDDLLGARGFLGRSRRACRRKSSGASPCPLRPSRIGRTVDAELADVREEVVTGQAAGFDGAAQEVLIQIVARRVVGGQERHDHGMQAGLRVELKIKRPVRTLALGIPVEQLQALAIEQEFQLLVT